MKTTDLKSQPFRLEQGRGYFPGLGLAKVYAEFEIAETRKWEGLGFPVPERPQRPLRKHLVTDGLYVDADGMIWSYLRGRGWVFRNRVALCEYLPGRGGFFDNVILPQLWIQFEGFENVRYWYCDYIRIRLIESGYIAETERELYWGVKTETKAKS